MAVGLDCRRKRASIPFDIAAPESQCDSQILTKDHRADGCRAASALLGAHLLNIDRVCACQPASEHACKHMTFLCCANDCYAVRNVLALRTETRTQHTWIWRCKHCERECVPVRSSSFCICGHRQQYHARGIAESDFRCGIESSSPCIKPLRCCAKRLATRGDLDAPTACARFRAQRLTSRQ